MPPAQALHIIEPTFTGFAGHCHSLVRALVEAAPECDITVWAGRGAVSIWQGGGRVEPLFRSRWRRLQQLWLLRRLLLRPGRVLVSTAGTSDFVIAGWAGRRIEPQRLFLFVHWLGAKPEKARRLSAVARRQPHIEVLAPTAAVVDFFTGCGFRSRLVPYPLAPPATAPPAGVPSRFRHLLVAGGARTDKGFARVVDLVAELHRRGLDWPVTVQISGEDRHGVEPALLPHVGRLRATGYRGLTLVDEALGPAAYAALFDGAVVVQPYAAQAFADRVSGVTLDALGAGAPVVVTAGTWMAALVERCGAGVGTADLSAGGLLRAIRQVVGDYPRFAGRARESAPGVLAQHSARRLVEVVLQRAGR